MHAAILIDDVCEELPTVTDQRSGRRIFAVVSGLEVHIVLVANPGDELHTVTTIYEVDRRIFPDGRTRRRPS